MLKYLFYRPSPTSSGTQIQRLHGYLVSLVLLLGLSASSLSVSAALFVHGPTALVQVESEVRNHRSTPCPKEKPSSLHTHASLQNPSPYLFLIAHCSKLLSAPSNVDATLTAPDVTVSWSPPAVGSENVSSYEVWRLDSADTSTRIGSAVTDSPFIDQNVTGDPATYQYRVRAVDVHGHPGPFSHNAKVGEVTPPSIQSHPLNATVVQDSPVTFPVVASGSEPLTYQWQEDGQDIPGATSASYTITQTAIAQNGSQFTVVVSNAAGIETSSPATLTVQPLIIFYQASDGLVSMEAEHAQGSIPGLVGSNFENHFWNLVINPTPAGASGSEAMQAQPHINIGGKNTGYAGVTPQLDFVVKFVQTGTHYIWVRGLGPDGTSDSIHIGLDISPDSTFTWLPCVPGFITRVEC